MPFPADSHCFVPKDSDGSNVETVDSTRMGLRRRRMALIVTLLGLATFVCPLVETDSEVLGRTRWSALQVILELHSGRLPIRHEMSPDYIFLGIDALLGFGTVYLLLSLIAAAIVFLPSARFVGSASLIGAAVVFGDAKYRYFDFQDGIYGAPSAFSSGHQVYAGIFCLILLGLLGLLAFIAATKQLD
jgi:hypothetical protein